MKIIFNKSQIVLWLAIFLFSLLGGGQNVLAQWGLVDTVWVARPSGGECNLYPSDNDSLYLSCSAVWKTIDHSLIYLVNEPNDATMLKFINDSTIYFHKLNQLKYDSVVIVNLKTLNRERSFNIAELKNNYLHSETIINSNHYSKVDNCVYGFGNKDETGQSNTTRKLNLETGEITEVPFLNGLAGGSISQDGELVAGYYFQSYWKNGKTLYDQYFKVYSLKTGETIISSQVLTTGRENIDIFPEFIFSKDHHYLNVFSFGSSHIWDLQTKSSLKDLPKTLNINSINKIGYSKIIFSKDNTKLLTTKSYAHKTIEYPWIKLDSLSYLIINLKTLKETEYMFPVGVWVGGKNQSFVFDDYHILCDQAWTYDGTYSKRINLGNSCLLKLNFDINSMQRPEQKYEGVLYPNPATEYIIVGANGRSPLRDDGVQQEIRIYDIFGKCVLNVGVQNFEPLQKIDISTLPEGAYFLRAGSEVYKFMVMR